MFCKRPCSAGDESGFTVFELLVAVVMLGMVSVMLYSILNVGIKFSEKGEKALSEAVRQHGILNLLHRQIVSATYDTVQRKVLISADSEMLRVVTQAPLRYRSAGSVLALYRYNAAEQVLYYGEKLDYYNPDFGDDYLPDFDSMLVLASGVPAMSFEVDEETQTALVTFGDEVFELQPRCAEPSELAGGGRL